MGPKVGQWLPVVQFDSASFQPSVGKRVDPPETHPDGNPKPCLEVTSTNGSAANETLSLADSEEKSLLLQDFDVRVQLYITGESLKALQRGGVFFATGKAYTSNYRQFYVDIMAQDLHEGWNEILYTKDDFTIGAGDEKLGWESVDKVILLTFGKKNEESTVSSIFYRSIEIRRCYFR